MWKCNECGSTSFSIEREQSDFNENGELIEIVNFDTVECNGCGNNWANIENIAYWEED